MSPASVDVGLLVVQTALLMVLLGIQRLPLPVWQRRGAQGVVALLVPVMLATLVVGAMALHLVGTGR